MSLPNNNMSNNFGQNKEVMGSNTLNKDSMNKSKKNEINNNMVSCDINDSFGDNILQNLNKYRKMALGESSISQSMAGQK